MNLARLVGVVVCLGVVLAPGSVSFAQMTSSNFRIDWDNLSQGGGDTGSSSNYELRDSVGGQALGRITSTSYDVRGGYRGGIYDQTVAFEVLLQDATSQVGASALSGSTVTVSDATGFSVGDYVAVVQDEGASQVSAMGKISSVSGSDLVLDWLAEGDTSVSVDGTSDYVYALDGTSLSLGSLSSSAVATSIVGWEASTDVPDGYSVYVEENRGLAHSNDLSNTITDVSDGTVSAGSEEYGARSSDSSIASTTFDTADTAITTTAQIAADRSAVALRSRDFLTLKAAIAAGTDDGSYSHTISVIYVGDF